MVNDQGILERFRNLNIWRQGDRRAPHKPLLALYALGQWQRGQTELKLDEVDHDVGRLLRDFGPPHTTSAEYPFWHLQRDTP